MATVYKRTHTNPLPARAEIVTRKGKRVAQWTDGKGKRHTAPLTADGTKVILKAGTYTAKYRDGNNFLVTRPTGCRDEQAARTKLTEWTKRAEQVRSGVLSAAEDRIADHQIVPIRQHFDAYIDYLKTKEATRLHRENVKRYLILLADECAFKKLSDLDREVLEHWLLARSEEAMSARSRNGYRGALVAFCHWCVSTSRMLHNPLERVPKANENIDRRRVRRSLTEPELERLLAVARTRPLQEAQTIRRGERKGQLDANVKPKTRDRLERLGHERALIYKTLVLTGLRKGELASLTVDQLVLDAPRAYVILHARDEKNQKGSYIFIRDDLVQDLTLWLTKKLEYLRKESRASGESLPARLPPATPLFYVPTGLVRILNRDMKAAGIPKIDGQGRTVDVHAMRTTFGTHLSKGGVTPRVAQSAMRHSCIDLTMNVYTDPQQLDVHGALNVLPALPLDNRAEEKAKQQTGTDATDSVAELAPPRSTPKSTPPPDKPSDSRTNTDKVQERDDIANGAHQSATKPNGDKDEERKTNTDKKEEWSERLDLNQRPLDPQSSALPNCATPRRVRWRYSSREHRYAQARRPDQKQVPIPHRMGYSKCFPPVKEDLMGPTLDTRYIQQLAAQAVEEDLGSGDITSASVVPEDLVCTAQIVAKQPGVLAGIAFARAVCAKVDRRIRFNALAQDSFSIDVGSEIVRLEGPARSLLAAERPALNFLQHLSGIATLTARYVERVYGSPAKIMDTRKTTPGLRLAQKYAVAAGGGYNHRLGLHDMVLIKDNHLALARPDEASINQAISAARDGLKKDIQIQVEVSDMDQLKDALDAGPDLILLDNMTASMMKEAVQMRDTRAPDILLEASGNVSLKTVGGIAETGVDRISVGALTHSAPALDIALYINADADGS